MAAKQAEHVHDASTKSVGNAPGVDPENPAAGQPLTEETGHEHPNGSPRRAARSAPRSRRGSGGNAPSGGASGADSRNADTDADGNDSDSDTDR